MTITLFQAIDRADQIIVDGFEIDEFAEHAGEMRLICDEDNEFSVRDQDIHLDDGYATITDIDNNHLDVEFRVFHQLQPGDIPVRTG